MSINYSMYRSWIATNALMISRRKHSAGVTEDYSHVDSVDRRGLFFFFSSRRRHTRLQGDWSSDVCSSDLHDLSGRLQVAQEEGRDRGDAELTTPGARGGHQRGVHQSLHRVGDLCPLGDVEIGRASCRERV